MVTSKKRRHSEFDGKYFGAYCPDKPINYFTAQTACQDSGGYLALPTTVVMNTWVCTVDDAKVQHVFRIFFYFPKKVTLLLII